MRRICILLFIYCPRAIFPININKRIRLSVVVIQINRYRTVLKIELLLSQIKNIKFNIIFELCFIVQYARNRNFASTSSWHHWWLNITVQFIVVFFVNDSFVMFPDIFSLEKLARFPLHSRKIVKLFWWKFGFQPRQLVSNLTSRFAIIALDRD